MLYHPAVKTAATYNPSYDKVFFARNTNAAWETCGNTQKHKKTYKIHWW